MKKILVISNDKINLQEKMVSSRYNDVINIIEAIHSKFNIFLISRNSSFKENYSLNIYNKIHRINFFSIFFFKHNIDNLLIISITPLNFIYFLIIKILKKKIKGYVYLRSNGYIEYKIKFGKIGEIIYKLMQKIVEKNLRVISVSKKIPAKKIHFLVTPSELNDNWTKKNFKLETKTIKILYFGRFKKEKGFFSLIEIFKKIKNSFTLTLAGDKLRKDLELKNIKFLGETTRENKIIKLYDMHHIFILPSFTEGSPKVILESLARKKPVIVFDEIKHVKKNYEGVFICKRNSTSLERMINFIIKNYDIIQKKMSKNHLITKKNFQDKLANILNV